ncbi:LGFP repeat-containing protein [Trinickia sp. EG282A]|uniref:LGFP repeat-containing protein n=1 Tax=Trinickia sp. EG282A TaxID=3237013 RepID=UPI0034D2685C
MPTLQTQELKNAPSAPPPSELGVSPIGASQTLKSPVATAATIANLAGKIALSPAVIAEMAIEAKYSQLGGAKGLLGSSIASMQASSDGLGYFNQYRNGAIYWSPLTDAHEVQGLIRDKWNSLGAERSFLGYPLTDETSTPDGVGRYNHFQGGSIYWTAATGAFEVHGLIRDKWASMGWERSFLGYPLTDESGTPDGVGRFNHFQGGSIYWTPATGAWEVHGAIRDKWASMGWERSFLGYPVSDEMATPDGRGRVSNFQRGSITWTADSGALPTPLTLHFHDVLTSGLPLGGWVDILLNSQGNITFSGHLHDSGFDNIDYTLSAVIVCASGLAIGFQRTGHTEGTVAGLPFGTPNRDDDWVKPDSNQQLIANWDQFSGASLTWRLDATDTLAQGALQMLGDLANQGLKALGSAATAALIALIFA